jgi:hypothetical protein
MSIENEVVREALMRVMGKIDLLLWDKVRAINHVSSEEEEITFKVCSEHFWNNYEIYTEVDENKMKMYFKLRKKKILRSDIRRYIGEEKLDQIEKTILGEINGTEEEG